MNDFITSIPVWRRPEKRKWAQLDLLDSQFEPGLLERDFKRLITRCRCGMIVARSVFGNHICVQPPEVIDLSDDDSDIDITSNTDDDSDGVIVVTVEDDGM
jgi:hypothetical protein